MAFNNMPYTNFQDLNLNWILNKVKDAVSNAIEAVGIANNANNLAEQYSDNIDTAMETANTAMQTANRAETISDGLMITNREITGKFKPVVYPSDWVVGNLDANTGEEYASLQVIRTPFYPFDGVVQPDIVQLGIGETVDRVGFVYCYDYDMNFLGRVSVARDAQKELLENTKYIRLTYGFRAESGLTVEGYGLANLVADFDMDFIPAEKYEPFTQISAVGAMAMVGESYLNVSYSEGDSIIYENNHGPYYKPFIENSTQKATSCSQFLKALLTGTYYDKSGFVNGTGSAPVNTNAWWGYEYDASTNATFVNAPTLMNAANIAKYCSDKGWLVPFDTVHNNIKPGDIVFFTDGEGAGYLGITHCALVLSLTDNGCYLLHAGRRTVEKPNGGYSGIEVQQLTWNTNLAANFVLTHSAHIPVIPTEHEVQLILDDRTERIGSPASSGSSTLTYQYYMDLPIGLYTVVWEDEAPNRSYISVRLANSGFSFNVRGYRYGSKYHAVFFATDEITSLVFRMSGGRDQIGHLKSVRLYKGYYDCDFEEAAKGYNAYPVGRADGLPPVTTADNGKFLRVVSGEWAAATVPNAESNSFGGV